MVFKEIVFKNKIENLGVFAKKVINSDQNLSDADKYVLLNYPTVYMHFWKYKNEFKWNVYIGESINLVNRTNQHEKVSKEKNKWQEKWWSENVDCRKSYYFSGTEMNKSLCLDIEDSLILLFEKSEGIITYNKRENSQAGYSNKNLRNKILGEIMNVLIKNISDLKICQNINLLSSGYDESKAKPSNSGWIHEINLKDYGIEYVTSEKGIEYYNFENKVKKDLEAKGRNINYFFEYPVVYMHMWKNKNGDLSTYVGETNNLIRRTVQHYLEDSYGIKSEIVNGKWVDKDDWQGEKSGWRKAIKKGEAKMYVFACEKFNKSMTMDIENRLIHYTIFAETSKNGRTNEQGCYSNKEEAFGIFEKIVDAISTKNPSKFSKLGDVVKKSVFMASPFMQLNSTQEEAKNSIISSVSNCLENQKKSIIVIRGGAGTGKTVLLSSLFFSLLTAKLHTKTSIDCRIIVNHKELYNLYYSMSGAWQLGQKTVNKTKLIWKAESFVNAFENISEKPDVVLVDEGHLLCTRGTQGAKAAQLPRIVENSAITILVFDEKQFVENGKYWIIKKNLEEEIRKQYGFAENIDIVIHDLTDQMRMKCSDNTKKWIESIVEKKGKMKEPQGNYDWEINENYISFKEKTGEKYEVRIYKKIGALKKDIADADKPSCLLATYEWEFPDKKSTKNNIIKIGEENFCWHETGNMSAMEKSEWTLNCGVDEVGAYHDIQGFDLLYAGVILGFSVQYNTKEGMKFVKKEKDNLLHLGGLPDNDEHASLLISNEVGVLLTRATKGLYLYSLDSNLRNELLKTCKYSFFRDSWSKGKSVAQIAEELEETVETVQILIDKMK